MIWQYTKYCSGWTKSSASVVTPHSSQQRAENNINIGAKLIALTKYDNNIWYTAMYVVSCM